jgi:ABC-2 type transport system ATP-binding protein
MQDGYLFGDTISRNIAESEPDGIIDKNKLAHAVQVANLTDFIENLPLGYNTKVGPIGVNISGGQKQRFSIATTLINDPKIIFLDEPTTGLDPQARRNLWDLIKNIRAQGTTVIITTHYMDEAEYLCDRVAIMDAGKIIALDHPDQLIDQLLADGFEKKKETKGANLEDVFIQLTGHTLRED